MLVIQNFLLEQKLLLLYDVYFLVFVFDVVVLVVDLFAPQVEAELAVVHPTVVVGLRNKALVFVLQHVSVFLRGIDHLVFFLGGLAEYQS